LHVLRETHIFDFFESNIYNSKGFFL
jgi:hypothetical protein